MRIGFFLPHIGPASEVSSIIKVARRAEELGFSSLWVTERLLFPVEPQTSYFGYPLPEPYKRVFDPLGTLTFVSAITEKIDLGTSVLDIPFYNPVLLARQLTAIDVLSNGRLKVGFGLGWSKDEFDATGADVKDRGRRADEFLQVLKAIWTSDPTEFHGKFFQLPKSIIQPKPKQKPHPPIYLASFAAASLKRIARLGDGWMPVGASVEQLKSTDNELKRLAKEYGRDSSSVRIIARYNLSISEKTLGKDRAFFSGSLDQIKEDVLAVKAFGPYELILDPSFSPDGQSELGFLRSLEEIFKMI